MRSSVIAGLVPLASAGVLTRHHTTTTTEIVEIVPSATFHPHAVATAIHTIHTMSAKVSPLSTAIVEPIPIPEPSTIEMTMTEEPTFMTATTVIPETTVVPQPTIKPATTLATTMVSTGSSEPMWISPSWGKQVVKDTHGDSFGMYLSVANDVVRDWSRELREIYQGIFPGESLQMGIPLTLSNPSKDIYAPTFVGTGEPASWNLRNGDLLTAGALDEMYFRIAHHKGDGFQIPVITTNKHKNHLDMYHNAKLQGNHDWQFKLDQSNGHYHLQNNEDKGSFYVCADPSPVFDTPDSLFFAADMQNLPSDMCFPVVLAAYQFA